MKTMVSFLVLGLMWCLPIFLAFRDIGFVFAIGVVWFLFNLLIYRESDPCSDYLKLFLLPLSAFVGDIPGTAYCVVTIVITLLLIPAIFSLLYFWQMLFDPVARIPWIIELNIIFWTSVFLLSLSDKVSLWNQFNSMRQMFRFDSFKSIGVLCNTILLYLTISLVIWNEPDAFLLLKPHFTMVNPFQLDEEQLETVHWLDLYRYALETNRRRMPIVFYGVMVNADGSRLNHPTYQESPLDPDDALFSYFVRDLLRGADKPVNDGSGKIEFHEQGKALLVRPLETGYVYKPVAPFWSPVRDYFPHVEFFSTIDYRSPYFYGGDKNHPFIFTMQKETADIRR